MVHVRSDSDRGALIAAVSPATRADRLESLVHRLGITATGADAVLVIDVSEVVLDDALAVRAFVGALIDRGRHDRVRVVARRGTARAVLRRCRGAGVSVHSSIDNALADRVGAESIAV